MKVHSRILQPLLNAVNLKLKSCSKTLATLESHTLISDYTVALRRFESHLSRFHRPLCSEELPIFPGDICSQVLLILYLRSTWYRCQTFKLFPVLVERKKKTLKCFDGSEKSYHHYFFFDCMDSYQIE